MRFSIHHAAVAAACLALACGCGSSRTASAPSKVSFSKEVNSAGTVSKSSGSVSYEFLNGLLDSASVSLKSSDGETEKLKVSAAYTDDQVTSMKLSKTGFSLKQTCSYDDEGRLDVVRSTSDTSRSTTRYEYDEEGRLERYERTDQDNAVQERSWSYDDETGRVASVEDSAQTIEYTYKDDVLTRAASDSIGDYDFDYDYDSDGRLSSVTSRDIRYAVSYDDSGKIDEIRKKVDLSQGGDTFTSSTTLRITWTDFDGTGLVFYPSVPEGYLFDMEGERFDTPHTGLAIPITAFLEN